MDYFEKERLPIQDASKELVQARLQSEKLVLFSKKDNKPASEAMITDKNLGFDNCEQEKSARTVKS